MKAFIPLYMANVREFVRDRSALFWTAAFPVMFILIFGVIFSGGDSINFDIGVVNEDGAASERLVESLQAIEVFDVTTASREEELQALRDGDRSAVIVIPEGTGAAIGSAILPASDRQQSQGAALEVYYDPADQNTSQIVLNIIDRIVAGMNESITGVSPVLTVEAREVTATELTNIDYLLPGILAMSLMQLGLFGTAAPLVSMREKGVLRRMGATPLSRSALLVSQVAFRMTLAFLQTAILMGVGMLAFDVQIQLGNLLQIVLVVLFGASMFITLGYFLSTLANTEEALQGIVALPNFLFMFLSGIFWPVDFMPNWIRPLVDVIPLTYLGDLLRKVMIEAGSYFSTERSVLVLGIWLAVTTVLALRFFRWEPQG